MSVRQSGCHPAKQPGTNDSNAKKNKNKTQKRDLLASFIFIGEEYVVV